nr:hypothetical protein [Allomuricauda oceani]
MAGSSFGESEISVPRDRDAGFKPMIVPKRGNMVEGIALEVHESSKVFAKTSTWPWACAGTEKRKYTKNKLSFPSDDTIRTFGNTGGHHEVAYAH